MTPWTATRTSLTGVASARRRAMLIVGLLTILGAVLPSGIPTARASETHLSIAKSASSDSVPLGGQVTWTLSVSVAAAAQSPTQDIVVTDAVNPKFTVLSVTPSSGTCPSGTSNNVSCSIGDIAPGASATVTIVTEATTVRGSCGQVRNRANAATRGNPGNWSNPVDVKITGCAPALSISKQASSGSVTRGGTVTWKVTVTNASSADLTAKDVVVTDDVAADFRVTSVTASAGTCPSGSANAVRCELGHIATGSSATVEIVATTAPNGNCGDVDNQAIVNANNHKRVHSNVVTVAVVGCGSPPPPTSPTVAAETTTQPPPVVTAPTPAPPAPTAPSPPVVPDTVVVPTPEAPPDVVVPRAAPPEVVEPLVATGQPVRQLGLLAVYVLALGGILLLVGAARARGRESRRPGEGQASSPTNE